MTGFDAAYFERSYRTYAGQNPARKLRFYASLVEEAARGRTRPRILDLGCAFGYFLQVLGDGWSKFGVDASEFALEEARRRVPRATLALGRAEDIPFEGAFDVIAAFDVLEHLPGIEAVAAGVDARLAPGGAVVFVVPVYDGPAGPLVRLLDRDTSHVQRRSRRFWLEWAARCWRVESWLGLVRYYLEPFGYLHAPTRAFRRLTPAIAVVARKPAGPRAMGG
jgi:SAM-dependent methyltransferase